MPAITISEYVRDYELTRELQSNSVDQISICARLLERWNGGPVKLADLDERMLSEFLLDYSRGGKAPSTVRAKRVQLLSLWRAAADDGLCRPPTRRIRSVRVPQIAPTAWRYDEVCKLVETCAGLPRCHASGMRRSEWWALAIRVAWDSGLRWEDQVERARVDGVTPEGWLAMPQHKTGRVMVRMLSEGTMAALRDSVARHRRVLITPWSKSHETFSEQFRLIVEKSGVRKGTWKWLRRAGATDCEAQQAGSATNHLGHAPGSRIAERHYIDPTLLGRNSTFPRPLPTYTPPPPPPELPNTPTGEQP